MSMEEAVQFTQPQSSPPQPASQPEHTARTYDFDRFRRTAVTLEDILGAKKKRNEAMERARERGLDKDEKPKAGKNNATIRPKKNGARRNPEIHAKVLLSETSLPFREIADITGLDFYRVVGLKLKLRNAA